MTAAASTPDQTRTVYIAAVVREYSDTETKACATEAEALDWLATEGLFLVEEGILKVGDPTPTFMVLDRHASRNGWTISLDAHQV